ncbi:MAG: glycosyl hydrolase family 28 protein [Clostridia bacterium]|nr:glycosyl hydrolase family 28 protein [Clostridia bacterium]
MINGNPVRVPLCRVSAMPYNTEWPGFQRPLDQTETAPFLSFSADEAVTIQAVYDHPVGEIMVRPLSAHIQPEKDDRTVKITLTKPGAYTLEADGFHEALHIFFDPVHDFEADLTHSKRTVLHYGPGIHHIGRVELSSDTTVLIDRDAVIYGSFLALCAENVSILGYGVIDGSEEKRLDGDRLLPLDYEKPIPEDREGILALLAHTRVLDGILRFYRCRNVRVEGVILRDSSTFALIPAACENVVIERVKTIGMWRYNSDGVDVFNSANVVIRNGFFRDFDDCIVLKGIAGWDDRNNENILVEHCVTWCDWGRNLEIGAETNAPEYRNIIFRDCDCIHGSSIFMDVHHHNRAEIHDVIFDDIRAEYTHYQLPDTYQHDMTAPFPGGQPTRHPLLMALPIRKKGLFAKDGLSGTMHDITFRHIRAVSDAPEIPMPESMAVGVDEDHRVDAVRIEDVTFNGEAVRTKEALRLFVGDFVGEIHIQ